jgi:hypothetical protein
MSNHTLSRTSVRRWSSLLALLLALVAVLITLVAAVNPALLGILQHPRDDVFLITGFLIVAMLGGSLLFPLYFELGDDDTDAYEPEATPDIPYPGMDVEPLTKHPLVGYHATADKQDAIRDRLRTATTIMIHRQTGISTDEASVRVERGDWTENATAAWFLGETPPPPSIQFYARISDSLAYRHGARETIHEILAYEQRHNDTEGDAP